MPGLPGGPVDVWMNTRLAHEQTYAVQISKDANSVSISAISNEIALHGMFRFKLEVGRWLRRKQTTYIYL